MWIHHLTRHVLGYKTSTQIAQQRGNISVAMRFGEVKPLDFFFEAALLCTVCMYRDVHDTPGIVSGQKALFGSPLGEAAR